MFTVANLISSCDALRIKITSEGLKCVYLYWSCNIFRLLDMEWKRRIYFTLMQDK